VRRGGSFVSEVSSVRSRGREDGEEDGVLEPKRQPNKKREGQKE